MSLVPPYHTATYGLAENAVKTFKRAMEKTGGDLELRLDSFLFDYRVTSHVTTAIPTSEKLMDRRIRTRFDLLKPSLVDQVVKKQGVQQRGHEKIPKVELEQGDHVYYKNYSSVGPPNILATVETRTVPVSCKVSLVRRHFSQLFKQLQLLRGKVVRMNWLCLL